MTGDLMPRFYCSAERAIEALGLAALKAKIAAYRIFRFGRSAARTPCQVLSYAKTARLRELGIK